MLENVERTDAETFKNIVDEEIVSMIENGFPAELVEGVMATQELENKIVREQANVGVEFVQEMAYNYAISFDPWYLLIDYEAVTMMNQWNEDGSFRDTAEKYLTETELTTLVTTYTEPGLKEEQEEALAQELAQIKEDMTEEEIEALVAQTDAEEAEESEEEAEETEDYVKMLTAVTVDELPEEIKEYDITDETAEEDNIRMLYAVAGVDGVGINQVMLDAQGIAQEDLHYLNLFTQLTSYLDTTEHTRGEIETLSTRYLYSGSVNVSLQQPEETVHPYLSFSWIANTEDLEEGYDLMNEIIFSLKLDDAKKLAESVSSIRSTLRSSINAAPHQIAAIRGLGLYDDYYRMSSYLNGVDYYLFLEEVEAALEEDEDAVIERLTQIQTQIHNRTNAVVFFAGDEEYIETNKTLAETFLDALDAEEIEPVSYALEAPAAEEALIIESNVQYNGIFAGFEEMGLEEYSADMEVFTSLVLDQLLYPLLRDQYGAYSVMHGIIEDSGMYLLTYRDPNIEQTFAVYQTLTEELEAQEWDQETIDGYIMSTYAYYAMPEGELSGAISALSLAFVGESQDYFLTQMRKIKETTPETILGYAGIYDRAIENGSLSTTGSAGAIGAVEDMYTSVRNPFGAADLSDAAFSDLAEDDPNYEYVMAAYQAGYMQPKDEETFGVADDATVGEFALALFTLLGGSGTEDDAVSMLAEAGLLPKNAKASDPLTVPVLEALGAGGDIDWSEYVAGDVVTRGELARILMEE